MVATAVDVLAWCAADATQLPDLHQHASTGTEVGGSGPVGTGRVRRRLFPPRFPRPNADGKEETERFDELVEWVRRRGRVGEDAAGLVVMFDVRAAAFGSWRAGLLSLV